MPNPIINNLVIEIHVPDFGPIREFYSKIGFEPIHENPKSEKYPGYLVMKRKDELGDTILHFYGDDERVYNQSYFKKFPKDTTRGYAIEITIPVKDVDKAWEDAQKNVPDNIEKTLQTTEDDNVAWRDFRLSDPYGYYIRITELMDWGQ